MATYKSKFDKVGIAVSLACMLHCIMLPMLLTTLPLFGIEVLENWFLESTTIFIAFTIGGWSVWHSYQKHHRQLIILILFAIGISLIVGANFQDIEKLEMAGKGIGAVLVITAHVLNWIRSRQCITCK